MDTRQYYNRLSPVYDWIAGKSEGPLRDTVLELFAAREGEAVLELGCGTGTCLSTIAEAVGCQGRVVGLDLAEGMLRIARRRLSREGFDGHVDLLRGDARRLGFPEESFDGVLLCFTLELFSEEDRTAVLREVSRVLRPGGRIAVLALSSDGRPSFGQHVYRWIHRVFPQLADCEPIALGDELEAAGFNISRLEQHEWWVPVAVAVAARDR